MILIIVEIILKTFLVSRIFLFFFNVIFLFLFSQFLLIKNIFKRDEKTYKDDTPITIIVPAYNEEKNIASCFEHVLRSDYRLDRIEMILVNDQSTDNTLRVAKKYLNKFGSHKIILGNHIGKSDALNKGIKSASNDVIVFIDADVQVGSNYLKMIVDSLNDKKVGCSVGPILFQQSNLLSRFQSLEFKILNLNKSVIIEAFGAPLGLAGGATFGTKKSILKKIGYFQNDTLVEDTDLFARIYLHGFKAVFINKAICYTLPMTDIVSLFKQRMRWYYGGIQIIGKYKRKILKRPYFIYFSALVVSWYVTSITVPFAIVFFGAYAFIESGIESSLVILSKMTLVGNLMIVRHSPQLFVIHLFILLYYLIAFFSYSKVKSILDYFALVVYPAYAILLQFCASFSLVKYYSRKNTVFIKE